MELYISGNITFKPNLEKKTKKCPKNLLIFQEMELSGPEKLNNFFSYS